MTNTSINLQYTTINDPLPDFIYKSLKEYSDNANTYKPQPQELVDKLAKKHSISPEMIYITAGIDEAIQMFAKAYGQNAFVFTPSYVVYTDVVELGGKLTEISSIVKSQFSISTDKLRNATLIYLANPNNPFGFTPKKNVIKLIENNKDSIVCIDEAYGEFSPELSVIDQAKKYSHLVVFKSFSKDYGMAGNRIGYFVAHTKIINVVKNKTQWANVSYVSAGAAISALDHEEYFKKMRDDIHKRREDFTKFLNKLGFMCLPSKINAVVIKLNSVEAGNKFTEHLMRNHFVVSHGNGSSNIGLDKSYIRIAIGTKYQMDMLKQVIKEYV